MKSAVYIIVPAYNEGAVIYETVRHLLEQNYSVVIVDDGSLDDTEKLLAGLPVHYIKHCTNLGQGAALQTGISYALSKGAEFFVTFDADGQHSPEDIESLLKILASENADIVFGSRFLAGELTNISIVRKLSIQLARILNFMLTGVMLTDAHNGFRAFNRTTALSIFLLENGMSHATEILIQVRKRNLKISECPVRVKYTSYSRSKGQPIMNGFKIIQDLFLYKIFK